MTRTAANSLGPLCLACQRLRLSATGVLACAAFPEAIPASILDGRRMHTSTLPGDRGIRFEPDWHAPDEVLALLPAGA